jgi:hypothetical protein
VSIKSVLSAAEGDQDDEDTCAEVHVRTFATSNLSVQKLFSALHSQMFAYVAECRKMGLSFSTDAHARRYGASESVVMKANAAFSRAWGVSVIDASRGCEFSSPRRKHDDDEIVNIVWNDKMAITESLSSVQEEASKLVARVEGYSAGAAGAEFCRQLILDLLGRHTARAKVFDNKSSWHLRSTFVIPPVLKTIALCFSVLMNVYFVWLCVLYGGAMGIEWQVSWLFFCVLYIFFMFSVEMTVEAVMVGFVIPCQVLTDIRALMVEFKMRLNTREVFQLLLDHTNGIALPGMEPSGKGDNDEDSGGEEEETLSDNVLDTFSATDHFFVSAFLAKEFPSLPESVLIRVFRHVHPRMGLLKKPVQNTAASSLYHANGTRKGLLEYMTGLLLGSLSFVTILIWIGTQPLVFQKLIVSAPLPIICSVLTSIIYVVDKDSLLIIAGVVALGLAAIVTLAYYTMQGVRRTLAKSEIEDQELRKESKDAKRNSSTSGGYKVSISAFGVAPGQVLPESSGTLPLDDGGKRRASIINPSFEEELEVLSSIKDKATLEADIRRVSMVHRRDRQRSVLQKRLIAMSESKPKLKSIVQGIITKKRESSFVSVVRQAANTLLRERQVEESKLRVEEAKRKEALKKRLKSRLFVKTMDRHGASSSDESGGDNDCDAFQGFDDEASSEASEHEDGDKLESEFESMLVSSAPISAPAPALAPAPAQSAQSELEGVCVGQDHVDNKSSSRVHRTTSFGGAHQWKGFDRSKSFIRRQNVLAAAAAAASSESDSDEKVSEVDAPVVLVRAVRAAKRTVPSATTASAPATTPVNFHSVEQTSKKNVLAKSIARTNTKTKMNQKSSLVDGPRSRTRFVADFSLSSSESD